MLAPCANSTSKDTNCNAIAKFACSNCQLVAYCGATCQKAHWGIHKVDCKSPLGKKTWAPRWAQEDRTPKFVNDGQMVQYGGKKYIWGNVPAFDVVQLAKNEGEGFQGELKLLFAASGDFRNVLKTIVRLPSSYNKPVEVTLNDLDLDVVARNAIMLLIAFVVGDMDEAVDCIIHVWYSAFIRKSHYNILTTNIRPLIEGVCNKIKNKAANCELGKTWVFAECSLRLVLVKAAWDRLLAFTEIPSGLTADKANEIRKAVTLAESRQDYRDRNLLLQSSAHRIAKHRYWDDGLLLPFGAARTDFQEPNPTIFQSPNTWPLRDNADPSDGWSTKDINEGSYGPATADIYGKLFHTIQSLLRAFIARLSESAILFRFLNVDVRNISSYVEPGTFDRIEVSNISDAGYLGIADTLRLMVPLLQEPRTNPHATLITLFMNAVDENTTQRDQMADLTPSSQNTKRLLQYLPRKGTYRTSNAHYDPEIIKFSFARDYVRTYDHIFDRVVRDFHFTTLAQLTGAQMKDEHDIIEKWPFRLKLRPGQPGAQKEFDEFLSAGVGGKERYVEWRRIYNDGDETRFEVR